MSNPIPKLKSRTHCRAFIIDHLGEVKNQIGGVIGYKLNLTPEETEQLCRLIEEKRNPLKQALVKLLDECDAALTAASANVMNPDLAIACTQRARACRGMIKDLNSENRND